MSVSPVNNIAQENIENHKTLTTVLDGVVCKPLSFIAKKQHNKTSYVAFSFVTQS
ncbi:hypothetical protein [Polaribacter aestuariivivens]|uniref:hypothetical protein n=1 Tax=Polaribacter aestuariivivens TaxID=2304626 RepID=UPI003F498293